jgi:hypothetical protein
MNNIELAEKILDGLALTINSNEECNRITITEILNEAEALTRQQGGVSSSSDLLCGIKALIEKFDKLEDANHETAETLDDLHVKDTFTQVGTVYGICAEELRILIGEST